MYLLPNAAAATDNPATKGVAISKSPDRAGRCPVPTRGTKRPACSGKAAGGASWKSSGARVDERVDGPGGGGGR
uniref:Uncharacterized protein n=1 Tax=Arundo donax TaxID=35708 RepID=A0A0A9EVG3_ARUDO